MITPRGGGSAGTQARLQPTLAMAPGRLLIEAQEAERRRIARELHDVVGQALTAVRLSILAMGNASPQLHDLVRFDETLTTVDQAIRAVRSCAVDLRPAILDDLGLDAAVRAHLDRIERDAGIGTAFISDPSPVRLDPVIETAAFRLVQEALTNALRHAAPRHVTVVLHRTHRELQIVVRDDGVGFDVDAVQSCPDAADRMGLQGMHERAELLGGTLRITSVASRGTAVRASLPLRGGGWPTSDGFGST